MRVTIGDNSTNGSAYIVKLEQCDFMGDQTLILERSECRQLIERLDNVNR